MWRWCFLTIIILDLWVSLLGSMIKEMLLILTSPISLFLAKRPYHLVIVRGWHSSQQFWRYHCRRAAEDSCVPWIGFRNEPTTNGNGKKKKKKMLWSFESIVTHNLLLSWFEIEYSTIRPQFRNPWKGIRNKLGGPSLCFVWDPRGHLSIGAKSRVVLHGPHFLRHDPIILTDDVNATFGWSWVRASLS